MSVTAPPTPPGTAPVVPSSTTPEAAFDAQLEAWHSYMRDDLRPYVTAVAENVADNATDAADSATAAAASQTAAATSAAQADAARVAAEAALAEAEAVVATIPEGTINDGTTSTGSVWSSSKTAAELGTKQELLVSGTNIKTVGGVSLLGPGDLPLPTGAMVYLGAVTATNAASADVTGLDTWGATYSRIIIIGSDIRPASSGQPISMRFQQGGSWQTTNYRHTGFRRSNAGNATDVYGSTSLAVPVCGVGVSNAASKEYLGLVIEIDKPSDKASLQWSAAAYSTAHGVIAEDGYAYRDNTPAALQGVRIYANSGNITGTFRVYGISNS